jgi:hypothetical protein
MGHTADQAALIGLLARLRALGLTIIEVRRTPHHFSGPAPDTN